MNRNNQDYGYFQVAYYDFPAYDSLSSIFGTDIPLRFQYQIIGKSTSGVISVYTDELEFTIQTSGLKSAEQVAQALRQQILQIGMNAALGVSGYSQHRPVFGSI